MSALSNIFCADFSTQLKEFFAPLPA